MSRLDCVQLQNACRLCLSSDSNNVDILGEEGRRRRYQDKIWKHFSLWVCVEDNLPKAICQLCCCQLEEYHSFVLNVEEVQQNIHKMVSAQNYGASNIVESHAQPHYRKIPSDQTGGLSKKEDLNKSVKNLELPKDVQSDVPDLRINSDIKTCKNPSEIFTFYNSHLQGECFVATDAETESISVNVDCIKVEEDPLQIENDDISSDMNTAQAFSDSVNCDSLPSEMVSVQLSSNKNCFFLADTSNVPAGDSPSQIVQCRKSKEATAKTLVAVNNLRKKCSESSLSEERDSDAEEVQDSTEFQSGIRNVAPNSESDNHGKEGESEFGCSLSAQRDSGWEESENDANIHSSGLPLNIQLAKFYNYSCKMCEHESVTFSSFFLLCKHYRLRHSAKGYVICCGRKLMSKQLLVSHMLKHLQPGIYKCHECGKELASELTYEKHMIQHLPDHKRPFKCEHCLRGFACKGDLQSHQRIHLPDDKRSASVCNTCGKKFATQGSVTSHQRHVHEKVREVMCHICPKIFPSRSALKEHLYSHVAESEQKQCTECGKWLKNDSTLRSHMKSHSSQLFRCPHCSKVYNFPQSLRAHMRSHSNTHPYKCLECGKTFKLKKGLKTHAVQHTGEKPYQCPHCPRTFASSGNYYSHKKRMHARERAGNVT